MLLECTLAEAVCRLTPIIPEDCGQVNQARHVHWTTSGTWLPGGYVVFPADTTWRLCVAMFWAVPADRPSS